MTNPNAAQYANSGFAHWKSNENQEALDDFNKAIDIDPNDPMLYLNRGGCYMELHQFHNALKDYDKALSYQPDSIPILQNAILACVSGLQDYRKAITYYSKLASLEKNNWQHPYNIAACYSQLGEGPKSMHYLAIAEKLKQTS